MCLLTGAELGLDIRLSSLQADLAQALREHRRYRRLGVFEVKWYSSCRLVSVGCALSVTTPDLLACLLMELCLLMVVCWQQSAHACKHEV